MAYNTYYDLSIADVTFKESLPIIQEFRDENEDAFIAFGSDGIALEQTKWYTHTQDIKKFTRKYPDLLFILSGEGGDQGNVWKEYHQNGRVQIVYPDLVWPEFDPEKLR